MHRFLETMTNIEDMTKTDVVMKYLCKAIRNNPDTQQKYMIITAILKPYEIVLRDEVSRNRTSAEMSKISKNIAIEMLKDLKRYNAINVDLFESKFCSILEREIFKVQFNNVNPYIDECEKASYDKGIVNILKDVHGYTISSNLNMFIASVSNIKLGRVVTEENASYQRLTPNSKYKNLNRWNPKDRFYGYYGVDRKHEQDALLQICLEETRCLKDNPFTFCNFEFVSNDLKLLDLTEWNNFDTDLSSEMEARGEKFREILNNRISVGETEKIIEDCKNSIEAFMTEFPIIAVKKLFRQLIDEVFIPLDSDEDNDVNLKLKAYGSFHELSLWLETEFDGVLYQSTRMKRLGKSGECCVLFNPELAKLVQSSLITGVNHR